VLRDLEEYNRQGNASSHTMMFPVSRPLFPITGDRLASAAQIGGHYFWADIIAAGHIARVNPHRHIDVGSSIAGFVAHVSTFRQIEVIDIRPLDVSIPNVTFHQADLFEESTSWINSTDSLSCLSVLEHFGLGRYGDAIDYDGWATGLALLRSMLVDGGRLYLSVPTGEPQRTEFNAHRVFSFPLLRDFLASMFTVEMVGWVNDNGEYCEVNPHAREAETSFGATYGCSVWVLKRA
jgi:hypothetical protein